MSIAAQLELSRFKSLVRSASLDDIDIHCSDGAVRTNRMLLSVYSDELAALLQENPEIAFHPLLNAEGFGINLPKFSKQEVTTLLDVLMANDFVVVESQLVNDVETVGDCLGFKLRRKESENGSVQLKAVVDIEENEVTANQNLVAAELSDIPMENENVIDEGSSLRLLSRKNENEHTVDDRIEEKLVAYVNNDNKTNSNVDSVDITIDSSPESDDDVTIIASVVNPVSEKDTSKAHDKQKERNTEENTNCSENVDVLMAVDKENESSCNEDDGENSRSADASNTDEPVHRYINSPIPLSYYPNSITKTQVIAIGEVKCPHCIQKFKNIRGLKIHKGRQHKLMTEKRKPDVVCKCGQKFAFNQKLSLHNHQTSCVAYKSNLLTCEVCKAVLETLEAKKEHMISAHPKPLTSGDFICGKCGITCKSRFGLQRHMVQVHEVRAGFETDRKQRMVRCECKKLFAYNCRSGLLEHRKVCAAFRAKAQICELCDSPFESGYALKFHKKSKHSIEIKKNTCVCGYFNENVQAYRSHCIECEAYRNESWICDDCDAPFAPGKIKQHLKSTNHRCSSFQEMDMLRNPNSIPKYRICKCGAKFKKNNREGLKAHRNTCLAFMQNAVFCEYCEEPFENIPFLKNHLFKAHAVLIGEKNCPCGEEFSTVSQFRKHVWNCAYNKSTAICEKCNSRFTSQHALKLHVKCKVCV